jgi:predicted dehydrogenase
MLKHPLVSVLFVVRPADPKLDEFLAFLQQMPHLRIEQVPRLPDDLGEFQVVVTGRGAVDAADMERLNPFVESGGGWLMLMQRSQQALPVLFGAQPAPPGPSAELRVLFDDPGHPLAVRLPEAVYLPGICHRLNITHDDTEAILYADWHYRHIPVLVVRRAGAGRTACTTLQAYDQTVLQQILYRLLRRLAGGSDGGRKLGVGILGYAPWLGELHGRGIESTAGLSLRAACDLNPQRLAQAHADFPGIKHYADSGALGRDPEVDLVIVVTPPNIHARLCLQMMKLGKHVVCEKPLALNRVETDALVETAETCNVHLSCHQNRRWDVDYRAIRQTVAEGLIGDLFYMETFVGGFNHPCGYWHSHVEVSGGTAYDWGAHYLDWMVSLIPERVTAVIGTRHKRVWHDVTNADQERIQVRFAGGQEAEFLHSDIAAVRKPKWYLLGDRGAIVGHWRDATAIEVDPLLYFHQHEIPATEMPPDLTLYERHPSAGVLPRRLALPARDPFGFHRNLADHLLTGEPIGAPLADSVRVVAILEAAARSAANGGRVEVLDG